MEILPSFLEVVSHVAGNDELCLLRPQVVSFEIVGVLKAQFWTEEDRRTYPLTIAEQVLGVLGGISRSLSLDIVDKLVADGQIAVRVELVFEVVHHRCLGREAGLLSVRAEGSICPSLRRNRVGDIAPDIGDIALVHVPRLRVRMPRRVDLVIPGLVVALEVIVGVFAVVEGVGAGVQRIPSLAPGVVDAGRAGRLHVLRPGRYIVAAGESSLH